MHVCLGTRMPSCMCGVRGQLSGVISLLPPCRYCRGTQVTRFTGRILYKDSVNIIINIILVASLVHACWYFLRLLSLRVKFSVVFYVLSFLLSSPFFPLLFLSPLFTWRICLYTRELVQKSSSETYGYVCLYIYYGYAQYMILVYLFPRNPLD